jgi:hypothetical protein
VPQRLLRRPGRSPTGPRPSPARQQTLAEQTPATELEQEDQRDRLPVAAQERADAADPPPTPSNSRHDGVPIFPDTRGPAARPAYHEAGKLNNPPNSLLDDNDAKHGLEPPAERRARERREDRRPR